MKKIFAILMIVALVFVSYSCSCNREKEECVVEEELVDCPQPIDSTAVEVLPVE